ncbi:hypothetical protein GCM10018785_32270 [Streptomyces longispororuber]|uniref:Uncharacterized protein n=1 Tax=Streptomyces longispororuber TaxID=68230 RepID=A0A919DNR4_9ACTN|nr:hypothetical protein GCM10018785_32270 [Streptomyces longispororuber]
MQTAMTDGAVAPHTFPPWKARSFPPSGSDPAAGRGPADRAAANRKPGTGGA